MAEDEQHAAVMAMWQKVMIQIGEDSDKLVSENATAQDENPDDGSCAGTAPVELVRGPVCPYMTRVKVR